MAGSDKFRGDRPAARIQAAMDVAKPRTEAVLVPLLHRLINEERERLGKPPVELKIAQYADSSAAGHVDYSTKVAFYGEQAVLDNEKSPLIFD